MADTPTRAETVIKAGLSLVPFVGGSLAVIYADFITRRKARVAKMAEAALTRFPNGDEEFVRRMQQDPRLAELFMTGVQAAAATAVDAKAKALGMLLADAASTEDMASYDEKELLVLALADLEWPHIRGLKQLAEFPSDDELRSEMDESAMNDLRSDRRAWTLLRLCRVQCWLPWFGTGW